MQEDEIIGSTLSPREDREAAILSTLAPGSYSAVIRGVGGTAGVALFELYSLD